MLNQVINPTRLVVNLFVISRGVLTLPRKIWISIQDNIDPAVAAAVTLLVLLTLVGIVAHRVIARRADEGVFR
jgi:putative spermidine/putrescine transport system permease protein